MRGHVAILTLTAALAVGACEKTGEGGYEVQRPTVSVTTDTSNVPSVDAGKDTVQAVTPSLDVDVPGQADRPDTARRDSARRP